MNLLSQINYDVLICNVWKNNKQKYIYNNYKLSRSCFTFEHCNDIIIIADSVIFMTPISTQKGRIIYLLEHAYWFVRLFRLRISSDVNGEAFYKRGLLCGHDKNNVIIT